MSGGFIERILSWNPKIICRIITETVSSIVPEIFSNGKSSDNSWWILLEFPREFLGGFLSVFLVPILAEILSAIAGLVKLVISYWISGEIITVTVPGLFLSYFWGNEWKIYRGNPW